MEPKIYHQNKEEFNEYANAIKYWSNALGELHHHGNESIEKTELPEPLNRAYHKLFFEGDIGSLRYLVETERGYGIALINEYDQCYADDCGLSLDDLFQAAEKDAAAIAADSLFANAEIIVGEYYGFDNSHEVVVIFPADTPKEVFMEAANKLDTLVYQAAKTMAGPLVTMDTAGLEVDGHVGTWHAIDHTDVDGHTFWLMEHDQYGDNAKCIIVDDHGKLCLSGITDGITEHIVELLHQEVMPVERMPDPSISIKEMKEYGYAWGGMLPMREETAKQVMDSCTVYRLYGDDTEGMVEEAWELHQHAQEHGIFGVEKVDWLAYLNRERESENLAVEEPAISEPLPSAERLNQMLVYMINTYTDAVYGTGGDYEAIKKDVMSAIGMTEDHFESIKNDLDFVSHCRAESQSKGLNESLDSDAPSNPRLRAVNIQWDVDYEGDEEMLPAEIDIPEHMVDEDDISDYLSDVTGFCHKGFELVECEKTRVEAVKKPSLMNRTIDELIEKNIPRDHMTEEEEKSFVAHWFNEYERIGFAGTFESPYSDQKKYNGQTFEVLGRCCEDNRHDLEVLPVWKIRLACGDEIEAFPEEICILERELQQDNHFEDLKVALFNSGLDSIKDFLGYEIDPDEDKDVIENRLDQVYEQMPDDILAKFYAKFKIGQDVKPSLMDQINAASSRMVSTQSSQIKNTHEKSI